MSMSKSDSDLCHELVKLHTTKTNKEKEMRINYEAYLSNTDDQVEELLLKKATQSAKEYGRLRWEFQDLQEYILENCN